MTKLLDQLFSEPALPSLGTFLRPTFLWFPIAHAAVVAGCLTLGSAAFAAEPAEAHQVDLTKLPPASTKTGLTYAKDIRPMLEKSCFGCHGAERQKGKLRVDSLEALLRGSEDGAILVAGKSQESKLVISVAQIDDESAMPPKRRPGGRGGPGGGRGPGGPGGPGFQNGQGGPNTPAAPPPGGGPGNGGPGGPGRPGGPGGQGGPRGGGGFGPPPSPLTSEQVGLIRAWIDQGAK